MKKINHLGIPQTAKAETLLNKIKVFEEELKDLKAINKKAVDKLIAQHKKSELKISKRIYKAQDSLQNVCSHNRVEIIDDFDYHRREEWTTTICDICKKQI